MMCGYLVLVQLCPATLRMPFAFGLRNWKSLEYIDIDVDVTFGFDGDGGKVVIGGAGQGGN